MRATKDLSKKNNNHGITLIALVITIIAILAIGTVSMVLVISTERSEGRGEKVSINANRGIYIKDTLSMKEAYTTLNWFFNQERTNDVYQVKINIVETQITDYINQYNTLFSGEIAYLMTFDNEINNGFYMKFVESNYSDYLKGLLLYKNTFNDYVQYEDVYSGYNIVTNNCEEDVVMYKELTDSYSFVICLEKENDSDNLDKYISYCQKLIDNITIQKLDKKLFNNTGYLKLYEKGWMSAGGGHLYLNSKKISLDDKLTLDLYGYSVGSINEGINNTTGYSFEYGIEMMSETWNEEKENYTTFNILYVSDDGNGDLKDEISNDYTVTEKVINGYTFECYTRGYKDFYKYYVDEGYYLIEFLHGDKEILKEIIL